MEFAFLIVLAAIMAVFGIIGYQRGTRFSLLMTGLLVAGLMAMERGGGQITKLVNGLIFGVRFILAGGLQAMGGSGDKTEALKAVMAKMGPATSLVTGDTPGVTLLFMVILLIGLSLLLGMAKLFKGAASLIGLGLGLVNGYIVTAVLLNAVAPDLALLPMPFSPGSQPAQAATAAPAGPSGADLLARVTGSLTKLADSSILPVSIMVAIALFVFFATRFGNRGGGKKG